MEQLNNNFVKRGGHNIPCGIHITCSILTFDLLSSLLLFFKIDAFLWTATSDVKLCNTKDFTLTENPHLSSAKTSFLNR